MNLLWVENHEHFARMATRQFLADHTVTLVPSLAAARDALTKTKFEVVLVDFDLDDGKGDELVRELRASPTCPMLIATSSHEDGNRVLMDAGADVICGKLRFAAINQVLSELANTRKPHRH